MSRNHMHDNPELEELTLAIEISLAIAEDARVILTPGSLANDLFEKGYRRLPEWRDPSKCSPSDPDERVLVLLEDNSITQNIGRRKVDTDRFVDGRWARWGTWVRYWMPIPVPENERNL